jgi:putative aldouronate transport system substrate-binding protein
MASSGGIVFRKDILTKYGIDPSTVKTGTDLTAVFKTIYDGGNGQPGVKGTQMSVTFGQNWNSPMMSIFSTWDPLSNSMGVLMNYGQDLPFKVANLFEQPEYINDLKVIRDWYNAGYIVPSPTQVQEQGFDLVKADRLASIAAGLKPGFDTQISLNAGGTPMQQIETRKAFSTTDQVGAMKLSVPITSKNPERAVAFMTLLFTDSTIENLLNWGIEGKDYVVLKDTPTLIDYPAGVNINNVSYSLNFSWTLGNAQIMYQWKGNDPDVNAKMTAFNKSAVMSKAMGFSFDATNVQTQIASCTNVINQYQSSFEYGILDLNTGLPTFQKALKDAGLDDIIAEKQKQIDAWAHANKLY